MDPTNSKIFPATAGVGLPVAAGAIVVAVVVSCRRPCGSSGSSMSRNSLIPSLYGFNCVGELASVPAVVIAIVDHVG